MHRHHPRLILFAVCLTALAGYVDALGFITFGGFFASFMSGNSTRFGISLSTGMASHAILCLLIIFSFVGGVVAGSLIGHASGLARRHHLLCFVSVLLLAAALLQLTPYANVSVFFMVMAMGAENAIFQRDGDTSIGLTYMTGTLVRMGQRIANIFYGGPKFAWAPFALLWAGFVAGAATGALLHDALGLFYGLTVATLYSSLLIQLAYRLREYS